MYSFLFESTYQTVNLGLLVLRLGIGILFLKHGMPKLMGGFSTWDSLGKATVFLGINFLPILWGFAAACAEFFGGAALILGCCTRVAAFFLSCVMIVAAIMHVAKGDPYTVYSHPLSLLVVFVSLIVSGPGMYSVDYLISKKFL